MRSFIENLGARRHLDFFEELPSLSPLGWQETAKTERLGWQATGYQGREKCRCPWNRHHGYVVSNRERHQAKSRIGYAGHAGIGDQGHVRASLEFYDQLWRTRHLVMVVIADGSGRNTIMA